MTNAWRTRVRRHVLLAMLLGLIFPSLFSCSSEPDSPEAQVRALVTRAEVAAEKKDLDTLKQLISESYTDGLGQDKRAIVGLLTLYFLRNQSIHLLTRVQEITFPEPARAEATVFVAMAGQPIPGTEELVRLRAVSRPQIS
ncbi:MAG: hypothetical protein ACE5JP_11980 [Candidatus Bipolaricaulia bacterium]